MISVQYHLTATGQIEKAIEAGQVWSQDYARDWMPHDRLGGAYLRLGQYEKALAEFQQARSRELGNPIIEGGLAKTYIFLGRFQEAKNIMEEGVRRNPERLPFRQGLRLLGFLEGDPVEMRDQLEWTLHKPGLDDLLFSMDSDSQAYFGRLAKARGLSVLAIESAQRSDFGERAALVHANESLREAEFGNMEATRQHARAALSLASGRDVHALVALATARIGDVTQARTLADHLNAAFPSAVLIQSYWLPTIRAEIELQAGNPAGAIELLRAAEPYELSATAPMIPIYVRAEAYLAAKKGGEAATEFQKFIQHRGIVANNPSSALIRLGLARAYALSGDIAKARSNYQDFLALWKDADPDIPVLHQAKAEYDKIR